MTACLLILNDPPYGAERSYNGLRLADSLSRAASNQVRVFLMGDAVACAKKAQKPPKGYYNLEIMLGSVARRGGEIAVCGSCMDARGISDGDSSRAAGAAAWMSSPPGRWRPTGCWCSEGSRWTWFQRKIIEPKQANDPRAGRRPRRTGRRGRAPPPPFPLWLMPAYARSTTFRGRSFP